MWWGAKTRERDHIYVSWFDTSRLSDTSLRRCRKLWHPFVRDTHLKLCFQHLRFLENDPFFGDRSEIRSPCFDLQHGSSPPTSARRIQVPYFLKPALAFLGREA